MPFDPEWEYHFRWAAIVDRGIVNSVDELEARDVSVEEHLLGYGQGGSPCSILFEFPFRWQQIVEAPYGDQIHMLSSRDEALETAFGGGAEGTCSLEFPFKWAQMWPGIVAGESWAIACAEENDRALEAEFRNCNCGGA